MEHALAVIVGIVLAASCGFRVFAPLLVVSAAANLGYLPLAPGFDWLGTSTALTAFAVAATVEIAAFYVPWLDHALDMIAGPSAAVAGAILFAATVTNLDPFLQWSLAIIAGGGSAALVHGGTMVSRAMSTATTGGLANFVVATLETSAGFIFSLLSLLAPVLALILLLIVVGGMYFVGRRVLRSLFAKQPESGF